MKEEIYNLIEDRQGVSFAELTDLVEGFRGEIAMCLKDDPDPNIILWPSVSEEALQAISELLEEGRIKASSTNVMVYMCDGLMPSLPIAKRVPKDGYKDPHWWPVVFNPAKKEILARV
jgi:hypothetical protein